jgi:thiol-disulfide isomerase/thioredoxin
MITSDGKVMNGRFIGSKTWRSKWLAERNDSIRLPRGESLVKVKQGATGFSFKFPGLDGVEVSDVDPRFKDKVVIIQAMGSWCPNCMDEAMFYQQLYSKYNSKGLEIVALSFEDKTFETSKPKMERFVAHTGATYTFLYAGPRGRESIRSVMYVLEGQMAYPTSMVIDKKGKIRRAETGFSGPGTGAYYLDYTAEFTQFIEELLKEE